MTIEICFANLNFLHDLYTRFPPFFTTKNSKDKKSQSVTIQIAIAAPPAATGKTGSNPAIFTSERAEKIKNRNPEIIKIMMQIIHN